MPWLLFLVAVAYAALLFRLAWAVDKTPRGSHWVDRPIAYALALGVYCTSWTFFGAVGSASTNGWDYLPIYLGPALLFLFGQDFLRRLAEAVRRENLTSIADYISSRYGKSRALAAVVTSLGTLAALPYIALQLKSLGMSAGALISDSVADPPPLPEAWVAIMAFGLAVFAIIFGARRFETTGRNRGLIASVAVEGAVKLAVLGMLGLYALWLWTQALPIQREAGLAAYSDLFAVQEIGPNFLTLTLLAMCAIVCLPRQFYLGFVEYRERRDLQSAHWVVPVYMLVTAIVVIPITLTGLALMPSNAPPDLYVLDLPLAHGAAWLALLAFVGGFSAATGMIVVECVALSTMLVNDLVAPFLLNRRGAARAGDVGAQLRLARRIAILAIMGMSFVFYMAIDRSETLASIGQVAFAAVAQFAPALVASLYWSRANRLGVHTGLVIGGLTWAYTLLAPTLLGLERIEAMGLTTVLGGIAHPQALWGLTGLDPLTHGVVWSLGLNILMMVLVSLFAPTPIADRLRAAVFNPGMAVGGDGGARSAGDLLALAERFVGADRARAAFAHLSPSFSPQSPVTAEAAHLTEQLVAQVIGAPSARVILSSALTRGSLDVADVVSLIDGTREELQFSRELLASTLDNISQGVSVIDRNMRLIAWNQRYLELFDFPPGFIHVGRPIADVIRYNAERGECGPGEIEAHVARRLAAMRRRAPHVWERLRPNGTVLKSNGNPMPGGGYVTSFTDITAEKRAQEDLRIANEQLETRVVERTAQLDAAKTAAEVATQGKTKFLAAASHDLLQPLNAARLFSAALDETLQSKAPEARSLAKSIDRSIAAADSLLRALLDISRLDAGGVTAKIESFPLDPLLRELAAQFGPLAMAKGLHIRAAPTSLWIETDRSLLRSAIQNFLSNAVRYTERGGVLVGARRRGYRVVVEVWDTGPGIPDMHRRAIFEEFRRLHATREDSAAGLGLAIVDRIARILSSTVTLRSTVGRGSVFALDAPLASNRPEPVAEPPAPAADIRVRRVLCVDNDEHILDALEALLKGWGAEAVRADSYDSAVSAMTAGRLDAALIDYQLGETRSGLDVIDAWRSHLNGRPFLLITASATDTLHGEIERRGGQLMRKPIAPAELKRFLSDSDRPG